MIRFKVFFEADDVSRRINVSDDDRSDSLFDKLRAKILTMIPADQDVGLYWFDSADSKVFCENEEELRIAVEECPSAARGIVDLSAVPRQRKPRPTSPLKVDNASLGTGVPGAGKLNVRKKKKRRPYALLPKSKVCEFCGAAYTCITHLATHMRKHTGERPFACDLCDKTYRAKEALSNHMKTHHGFKPFKCPFGSCRYVTGVSSYLNEHMVQMHGPTRAESEKGELHVKELAVEPKKPRKGKKKSNTDPQEEVKNGHGHDAPIVKEDAEEETSFRVLRRSKRTDPSADAVQQRSTSLEV